MIKILRYETYGVKNLKNKITIDFANATLYSDHNNICKVKAIYGGNGSGKSAIITSIYLLKKLLSDKNYIIRAETNDTFLNLFNKELNEMFFKIFFSVENSGSSLFLSYEIKLKLENNEVKIIEERYNELKGNSLNHLREKPLFLIENGNLIFVDDDTLKIEYKKSTINLLNKTTFLTVIFEILSKKESLEKIDFQNNHRFINFAASLYILKMAFMYIHVSVESEEKSPLREMPFNDYERINNYLGLNYAALGETYCLNTDEEDLIPIDTIDIYKETIHKLVKFIRIFKNDLQDIELDMKIDRDVYHISKTFVYEKYKIEMKYESTGIKRLVSLYPLVDQAVNGGIVFFDEFDANIGSVFLTKLIQYIQLEGQGQFCFTTHNFEPMKFLKKFRKSIDFLGETGKLVPRTTNGNYSPDRQYMEGMIEDSPFNFEYFEFGPAFYHDKDN